MNSTPENIGPYDPAQLGIFHALVESILDEMGEALRHGAFSQNIKERRDYSCALFNSDGDLVCGAAHIPVHLGSMDTACRAAIDAILMREGDAVLLNDPYSGGTHLPDLTVILPACFSDPNSPDFYLGVRAHHSDVGGIAPGSLPLSHSLEEEGLVIPPTILARDGEVREDVIDRLANASRQPAERSGDLRAQLAAGAVGLKRLSELAQGRGLDRILIESRLFIEHSANVLTAFLSSMNPATGKGVCIMDDIPGEPGASIVCRTELKLDGAPVLEIDLRESSDQHSGCLNAVPAIVRSAIIYSLRLFLPPDTPVTSGLLRPVRIHLRRGSVLDPEPGAAVAGGNVETSQAIVEALLLSFGGLGWDIPAASQGTMNNILLGSVGMSPGGFSFYETIGGGAGATSERDGASGIQTHMTNTRNTPIEALERAFPLWVTEYSLRDASGGEGEKHRDDELKNESAGTYRGGDGIIREFEILSPTRLTILSNHRTKGPPGIDRGKPVYNDSISGKPGRNLLIRKGEVIELPARVMLDLEPGDRIRIETPGGGGYK
jgi:N-methylhydantoinase B